MKKIFLALLFSPCLWAQNTYNPNDNTFKKSEIQNQTQADPGTGGGIGGVDPDPVPIDDYLPVLAIAAVGMVVYFGRRKIASAA